MGAAKIKAPRGFFLPYQKRWNEDASPKKLMEKSRQIGISWATAFRQVRETAMQDARFDCWISSRDEIQARLFIDDCKFWLPKLKIVARDMGDVIVHEEKKLTGHQIVFANGRRLTSMSSNPDAQAGKRGTRVWDEYALNPQNRQLYAIGYPGTMWGGQIEIVSTHRGSKNHFNELKTEIVERGNPKKFSLHTVTLQDALDQGFLDKLQSTLAPEHEVQGMDEADFFTHIRAGCADEESFQQEYMCRPADDDAAFLEYDLIAACEYGSGEKWEWSLAEMLTSPNPLYVGVDIGRTHDLTVIWVLEKVAGILFTRAVITLRKMPKPEQEKVLWPILAVPALRRACFDKTGLGIGWVDDAQAQFGSGRVEGVTFTGPVKEALAYPLRGAMEDRKLRLPYDRFVRSDLRAVSKTTTAAGNIRFMAERTANGHADRFWALALAIHAAAHTDGGYSAALC